MNQICKQLPLISELWFNLFEEIGDMTNLNILEFAGGNNPKIGAGLKRNFNGEYFIVDVNPVVNQNLAEQYKKLLPEAKIVQIDKTLLDASATVKKIDMVVANHALDDLFSFELCLLKEVDFPRETREKNISILKKVYLSATKEDINLAIENASNHIIMSITNLKPKKIVLSNYPSRSFSKANFNEPFVYSEILKQNLIKKLKQNYNVKIINRDNNTRYNGGWLVCQKL
jgi:hypothetical protein